MPNNFKHIFVTLILLLSLTTIAFARQNKCITAKTLNVREGAGNNYTVIGKVFKGETVFVFSEVNGWAEISFKNRKAYVSTKYLTDTQQIADKNNNLYSFISAVTWWEWLLILGIFIVATFFYRRFCINKFEFDIFDKWILISLSIVWGLIYIFTVPNFVDYTCIDSTVQIFLTTISILTTVGLYVYNLIKTNWYIAIPNILFQTIFVGCIVIIIFIYFAVKLFSYVLMWGVRAGNKNND